MKRVIPSKKRSLKINLNPSSVVPPIEASSKGDFFESWVKNLLLVRV